MVLSYIIYRVIAWIEVGHSYKDAPRVNRPQKLSQKQEREVRQKTNIANNAITAAKGPYATSNNLPNKFHVFLPLTLVYGI